MTSVPAAELEGRHARVRAAMSARALDGLLAFAPAWRRENVRYLTGRRPRAALAFAHLGATGPARELTPEDLVPALREDLAGGALLGIAHAELVPNVVWRRLADGLPGVRLESATTMMDRVRLVKTDWELDRIRRAAAICDLGWHAFLDVLRPGIAEYEVVAEVDAALKEAGAEDNFMIIASGGDEVRGMTPPSARRLAPGDMVRTELTPQWEGYWAQICRSAVVGPASRAQLDSWQVFEEAVASGLARVRAGVTAHDVAKAENDVFRRHGLGEFCGADYTRVRGHGHGLHLDEFPVVEGAETVLAPGVVLIVHPNTYTPLAGYHVLGDPVVVTDGGHEPLLGTPRALAEVPA